MKPHTSFVIGYHGCGEELAKRVVLGDEQLQAKERKWHWLGSGIYFWENDKDRALEWAQEKASRKELEKPFVIGAIIELRRCLDLSVRENGPILTAAYESLAALYETAKKPLPENKKAPLDQREDKVMRLLDCAVINHLAENAEQPFDTVRGLFVEGDKLYPGAEIFHKSHAEIAVRNSACIRGVFIPM
jgi:hypothetical protein